MSCCIASASRAALAVRVAMFSTLFACGCATNDPGTPAAFIRGLPVPAGWKEAPEGGPAVPGTRIGAWTGSSGAWLVAFRTLPDPRPASASDLAAEWAARHRNLAGYRVRNEGAVPAGGLEIARIDLGYTPAETNGQAATEVHRTYLGIPARTATYWLLWSYPEEQRTATEDTIAAFLKAWSPQLTSSSS